MDVLLILSVFLGKFQDLRDLLGGSGDFGSS